MYVDCSVPCHLVGSFPSADEPRIRARGVSRIRRVVTERKFQRGLRPDVNFTFKTERIPTMGLVIDKALIIEEDENYTRKKRENMCLAKTEVGSSKKQQS